MMKTGVNCSLLSCCLLRHHSMVGSKLTGLLCSLVKSGSEELAVSCGLSAQRMLHLLDGRICFVCGGQVLVLGCLCIELVQSMS